VCISDTHQHHKKIRMPDCDMIIHAGDFSYHGEPEEVKRFLDWFETQDAKYKLLVCGNHEKGCARDVTTLKQDCENRGITLLHNDHITIEGIKFFGSPYSVEFGPWAFGLPDEKLQDIWDYIEPDVNVVITHGPAYNTLDTTLSHDKVGSKTLAKKLLQLNELKLHVCGHIHESRGVYVRNNLTTVNASICGIPYTDVIINPITIVI
jgi:Icc-related predicted phosphoesterase